jgi:hypothetical protein
MCRGALYIVPIVVFSVVYNLSKFYEVQTKPGFYEFTNGTVSVEISPTMYSKPNPRHDSLLCIT